VAVWHSVASLVVWTKLSVLYIEPS